MAWSFIDSTKASSNATTATSITCTMPSFSSGDLAIITAYRDQDAGDWTTNTAGWTRNISRRDQSGRDRSTAVFYKVLGSSEPNPVLQYSNGISEEYSWMVHVFRSDKTLTQGNVLGDFQGIGNQNNPSPPTPSVTLTQDNSLIVCVAIVTHGDITSVSGPTGFTMADSLFGSSQVYKQQMLAYDLDGGSAGVKTLGTWNNNFSNTRGEYTSYALTFTQDAAVQVTAIDDGRVDAGDTNQVITGSGFKTQNGTSRIDIGDSADYATATKVQQTSIDSWADTSIQFDANISSFSNGTLYLWVTNRDGDRSDAFEFAKGLPDYSQFVKQTGPDIYHRFNNSYADDVGFFPANGQASSGSFGFVTTPITRNNTHSWKINDDLSRIEMADTAFTNVTVTHTRREIGGWIRLDRVHQPPSGIWEEGGGVNNLYIVVGFGNRLLVNVADSSNGFKAQAFSDFKLAVNRDYHVLMRMEGTGGINGIECYIDGVLQSSAAVGTPLGSAIMATHSGDFCYGRPDSNLDTGGTDIQYPGAAGTLYSDWVTYSEYGGGAPMLGTERRFNLFEMGARANVTISAGTQSAMQTQLDALANTVQPDKPLCILIETPTSGSDLTLEANNVTFDPRASIHVLWSSIGTLTWKNLNGSNASISSVSNNGTVVFQTPSTLTLTGIEAGTEVRIYDAGTTNELAGQEVVNSGTFFASIEVNSVDVRLLSLNFQNLVIRSVDTTANASVPVQQLLDRQYAND
jgi:hypothetical protein